MKDFRTLKVWQASHELTLKVYKASSGFPTDERYGLTSQIRRAASSIPTNIAEGCGRGSDADFQRFLQIAYGSANELDYQLLLAFELAILGDSDHKLLFAEVLNVKRMLAGLIRKLQADRR